MPFVQMENISHFLRACQLAPLSLPPHDVFLTVDLYEAKDPAQVLQCLGAFSRRANAIQPSKFPRPIGGIKSKGGLLSPQGTGSSHGYSTRARGVSNVSQTSSATFSRAADSSGRVSPMKTGSSQRSPASPPVISSWSKRSDESSTAPAWNIHQYGYMGGASQGNQGISFGARRQITTPAPAVPNLAEKEKRRREAEAEQERQRQEEEARRQREREEQEERAKAEEERRWAEETERLREKERRKMEEEKTRWDEEKRRWEEEEQRRLREEKEAEEKLERERQRKRATSDARLNGQFLSQYQAALEEPDGSSAESQRVQELERELQLAKEREQRYERERQDLQAREAARKVKSRSRSRSRPRPVQPSYDLSSQEQERKLLRSEWQNQHNTRPDNAADTRPPPPPRPLPEPTPTSSSRPLPDPTAYTSSSRDRENRTDRFLASNPAPAQPKPAVHRPADYSSAAEIEAENARRVAATQKTQAGGWASKSLLEREMERERERQREWEESQKQTEEAAKRGVGSDIGTAPGQGAWNVHQYGYLGGDSQNRGGTGLGVGGARRQIIGPRPPPR
jgi:hypothetical protein